MHDDDFSINFYTVLVVSGLNTMSLQAERHGDLLSMEILQMVMVMEHMLQVWASDNQVSCINHNILCGIIMLIVVW